MRLPTPLAFDVDDGYLAEINSWLETQTAYQRVTWALENLPGQHALSSSFGAQAAVSLHLVTEQAPDIPVILVDTGYLFTETYQFADELRERLSLNLHVVSAPVSTAWMEARFGKLWESGRDGIDRYNRLRKVEPMQKALNNLGISTWIAGLRRSQSNTRAKSHVLERRDGRWKLHPLIDWTDRDVGKYLAKHDLPYHPLWHKGYVSIGDIHSTRPLEAGMSVDETRFFGLKRECGLHYSEEH